VKVPVCVPVIAKWFGWQGMTWRLNRNSGTQNAWTTSPEARLNRRLLGHRASSARRASRSAGSRTRVALQPPHRDLLRGTIRPGRPGPDSRRSRAHPHRTSRSRQPGHESKPAFSISPAPELPPRTSREGRPAAGVLTVSSRFIARARTPKIRACPASMGWGTGTARAESGMACRPAATGGSASDAGLCRRPVLAGRNAVDPGWIKNWCGPSRWCRR